MCVVSRETGVGMDRQSEKVDQKEKFYFEKLGKILPSIPAVPSYYFHTDRLSRFGISQFLLSTAESAILSRSIFSSVHSFHVRSETDIPDRVFFLSLSPLKEFQHLIFFFSNSPIPLYKLYNIPPPSPPRPLYVFFLFFLLSHSFNHRKRDASPFDDPS